jgi:ubiquinone/menaquinone biosynthesis C-methylase UbiE
MLAEPGHHNKRCRDGDGMEASVSSPGEHDKLTQAKFDSWAENYESRNSIFKYFQKRVIALIDFKKPSNFLDLGCGTGWAVRYVSTLLKDEGHFVGIDLSEKMIKKAKEIAAGMNNVVFYAASSEALPLENDFFDNIICTFSFHHYLHPGKALYEAQRVLKPGGRIYILDPTSDDFLTKLANWLSQRIEKEHVKQYTTAEFKQMFLAAGLRYMRSRIILAYPIKVHIAEKL